MRAVRPVLSTPDADVDMGSTDASFSSDGSETPVRKPKPTYILRKEEKLRLQKEMERLQIQLKALEDEEQRQAGDRLQRELQLSLMRNAVQEQQLSLVNVQSAVSGYVSAQEVLPHETTLYLGTDFNQRREVLMSAKPRTISAAKAYTTARMRFIDPFRPFTEMSGFQLDSGDYCSLRLDHTPLHVPNLTVRQVFDAVVNNHASMEVRITDELDDITTTDDTSYGLEGINQSRIASRFACGVDVEMNVINFHEYFERDDEHGGGGPIGILTADFVDKDEVFPYRPKEFVRHDITGIVAVRQHTRKHFDPTTNREVEETVVALTRTCFFKLRRPEIPLPPMVEHSLREQLGRWGDLITTAVLEQIHVCSRQP